MKDPTVHHLLIQNEKQNYILEDEELCLKMCSQADKENFWLFFISTWLCLRERCENEWGLFASTLTTSTSQLYRAENGTWNGAWVEKERSRSVSDILFLLSILGYCVLCACVDQMCTSEIKGNIYKAGLSTFPKTNPRRTCIFAADKPIKWWGIAVRYIIRNVYTTTYGTYTTVVWYRIGPLSSFHIYQNPLFSKLFKNQKYNFFE